VAGKRWFGMCNAWYLLLFLLSGCSHGKMRDIAMDNMMKSCATQAHKITNRSESALFYMGCIDAGMVRLGEEPLFHQPEKYNKPFYSYDHSSNTIPYLPGHPIIDKYGRPRQFVPNDGGGGVPLGPITPNAYGPGIHMDATGRPVQSVPWP
jgi:hypothetical protein